MKKITLLACMFALFIGSVSAQEYVFNRMRDNWFVEGLGGAGVMMSKNDAKADFKHRLGWKANLAVGKWFSPLIGVRVGGEFNVMKGAIADEDAFRGGALGTRLDKGNKYGNKVDGDLYYCQKFNNVGGFGDVLFNATNWICGYRPGRFYNAVIYAGASIHWVFENEKGLYGGWDYNGRATASNHEGKWKYAAYDKKHARNLSLRAGLLNTFRLSNHVNLLLDLRFDMMQEETDAYGNKTWIEYPSALIGLSYKFNKTEWDEAETREVIVEKVVTVTDDEPLKALRNKLAQANAKIADLEAQLDDCLKKKPIDDGKDINEISDEAPLATIYYPIGKSYITPVQQEVVNAVAEVMKNEDNNYILTGWADNYTGNDAINIKLRHDRVNGVKKSLESKGIASDRLSAETNNGELTNYGPACAALDRAVTIQRAK